MRLLFDQSISYPITKKLIDVFPDCRHVSECGLMDVEDSEIWEYAKVHGYSNITFDSDFYDISLINGHPPKIIWFCTGNLPTLEIARILILKIESIKAFLNNEVNSCLEID